MKSAVAFLALVAAATAQTWPMVTVDTSGNIVLQSTTKTRSFKLITTAVTAAGTSTQSGATQITAGSSHVTVTAAASTNGVILPAAEPGFRVTLVKASSATAYMLYAQSGDLINNLASTTGTAIAATDLLTTCEAYDTANWLCQSQNTNGGASGSVFVVSASKAPPSATAPKRIGDIYVDTANKNFYIAKATSAYTDYVMLSKASSSPQIYTTTVRPGSSTTTSTTAYGKPAKVGDLLWDSANTGLYLSRGSTNGYDWARTVGLFRGSGAAGSSSTGTNIAKATAGDIITMSGHASLGTVAFRSTSAIVTGTIGSTGAATYLRVVNSV